LRLTITLSTDDGQDVASLVSPVGDADYLLLSGSELSRRYDAPYIEYLQASVALWLGRGRGSQQGLRFVV
jgi:hypothetical protein